MIERSRCRGIEVVAGVGVPAASSSVAGALAMNRPVQSDQRWINDDGDQQDLDTCKDDSVGTTRNSVALVWPWSLEGRCQASNVEVVAGDLFATPNPLTSHPE